MTNFLLLIFAHYLCDFGLQNDFIAKFKVPKSAGFWVHVMVAHCSMQALGVLLVTKNPYLALAEFVSHFIIDYAKCTQKLTFNQDQALHLFCKCVWFYLMGVL